jgi:hypothetical protein
MEKHGHPRLAEVCGCQRGNMCNTRCVDCDQYTPTCCECFIERHRRNFLHWVEVWDADSQFWRRWDMSSIPGHEVVIHLGHDGLKCPMSELNDAFVTTLVELNGIHVTKVLYCACQTGWRQSRAVQLLRAGFFPASVQDPSTAFSTRLLKFYEATPLVATQFTEGLRRVSDPRFPSEIPVRLTTFSSILETDKH